MSADETKTRRVRVTAESDSTTEDREYRSPRRRARPYDERPRLAPGLTRLAHAWTQANTQLLVGASEVLGDLVQNLTDDFYEGPPEHEDGASRSGARSGSRRTRSGRLATSLADSLTDALDQSADVLARSADRLASTYRRPRTARDEAADELEDARARRLDAEEAVIEAAARRQRAELDEREAEQAKRDATADEERSRQKVPKSAARPDQT